MKINSNISSMVTRNYLRINNDQLEKTMERLSSGKQINSAGDDAAGSAIVSRLDVKVRGMSVAARNAADGVSLIQATESALGNAINVLQRIRELAVQASNGTYNSDDKKAMQYEIDELLLELDHISTATRFNGLTLLDGSVTNVSFQVSETANDFVDIPLTNVDSYNLNLAGINVETDSAAVITTVDNALSIISNLRSDFGSAQNRLNYIIDNLNTTRTVTVAAKSRIEDADMAAEISQMSKNKILSQATLSMMTQANQMPQSILQLLQF